MAKWKLSRLQFGKEEFELTEGEVTIGRGFNNLIKLSSIVISRNHCIIKVTSDEVAITDLKSSNGVYVGRKKITPEVSYKLKDNDIIGFGWTIEASLDNIKDNEKHVYKLINDKRKRKLSQETLSSETENENNIDAKKNVIDVIVTIENKNNEEYGSSKAKKAKAEPILIDLTEEENEDLEYKVFKDTQDSIYNDEPELVLSDSEYESEHLFERLSQSSPGRTLIKNLEIKVETSKTSEEISSHNQIDDDIPIDNEIDKVNEDNDQELCKFHNIPQSDLGDSNLYKKEIEEDLSDKGSGSDKILKNSEKNVPPTIPLTDNSNESCLKKQIMEPLIKPSKNTSTKSVLKNNFKVVKKNTRSSKKSSNSAKITISNSQKEKRRTKLKEITIKEKEKKITSELNTNTSIQEFNKNNLNGNTNEISEAPNTSKQDVQNNAKTKYIPPPRKTVKIIDALCQIPTKTRVANVKKTHIEKAESNENIPPKKSKKKVRFSDAPAEVHEFLIEPGQRFEKLALIKKENRHLIDGPKRKSVSQKTIALEKILKWNTQWLEVQMKVYEPPPEITKEIVGNLFLSFRNHEQYMKQVGALLLLEIWEYIRQGYKDNKTKELCLTIESLPPKPAKERNDELFTIRVKLEISTSNQRILPRYGDIMIMKSKSDKDKWRFCFVNNVTYIHTSSSANFKTYCLHLFVKYTYQIEGFSLGEIILGRNIANINNVVWLFEAMDCLGTSPLRESILRPEPCQYPNYKQNDALTMKSKWTATLNESQLRAVRESVSVALGGAAALRMVQGPPGTGKSSVICAMVMSYFYDGPTGKKQNNRGKILICATSNFAVDELVIKLLNMRERLPPEERFRMVRVGRLEAMHGRAREISSQELAQREARVRGDEDPAVREQIELYQAKMNRWRTEKTEDPARAAYCKDRAAYCARQIDMLRGGETSSRQLLEMEHRLLECADVIATTLSSAVNHKMRGVKGIELCIVDEAGQAIEPEALLPLRLGVTKLTLVGDPQQLPGFICSQHAKKYGLDKSLFSRLSSLSEEWERQPVVLLDRQYRMHPAIADYPNRAFYGGKVQSVPPAPVHLDLPSYCILAVPGVREDAGCEVRGASHAALALALAARAHRPPLSVAVITPYVVHRDHMRAYLGDLMREWGSGPVEVNTVDSFQGQERDVVVVSLGRRRGVGFLADAGRMNVLLTRARHVLLVCLDPDAVREHEQWQTLVEDAKTKNLFKTLPHKMCQPSSSRQISPEEVLKFLRTEQKH